MYNKFFGFQKTPFDIVPNPDLLYLSQRHKIALDHLEFGLMSGAGFILLTGEVGTGKTTLIRNLIRRSIARETEIAIVFQTNVSAEQLLNMLLTEFELPTFPGDKPAALDQLNNFFLQTYTRGRKVLIIVDEAQNLSFETLEELRMLSNLQSDDRMLLQILLVGQPELKQKLMDPKLTQFAQRIAVNYHLAGLGPEETKAYISYRLAKAGGSPALFTPEAITLLHEASGGIPRAINLLCGAAMLYAYADERLPVSVDDVRQAVEAKSGLGVVANAGVKGKRSGSSQTAPIKPSKRTVPVPGDFEEADAVQPSPQPERISPQARAVSQAAPKAVARTASPQAAPPPIPQQATPPPPAADDRRRPSRPTEGGPRAPGTAQRSRPAGSILRVHASRCHCAECPPSESKHHPQTQRPNGSLDH